MLNYYNGKFKTGFEVVAVFVETMDLENYELSCRMIKAKVNISLLKRFTGKTTIPVHRYSRDPGPLLTIVH